MIDLELIQKDLQKVQEIFLAPDLSDEEKEENLQELAKWRESLTEAEEYLSWKNQDTTKKIAQKAAEAYKDFSLQLALKRGMTEEEIISLQAKQDACVFLLELTNSGSESVLRSLHSQLRYAIKTGSEF